MSDCPHCGEPVPEKAPACPHCGSDFETGWNPDADYYSLELPDDDDDDDLVHPDHIDESPPSLDLSTFLPIAGIVVAATAFLWMGRHYQGPGHVPAFLLLAVCCWLFFRWPGRSG